MALLKNCLLPLRKSNHLNDSVPSLLCQYCSESSSFEFIPKEVGSLEYCSHCTGYPAKTMIHNREKKRQRKYKQRVAPSTAGISIFPPAGLIVSSSRSIANFSPYSHPIPTSNYSLTRNSLRVSLAVAGLLCALVGHSGVFRNRILKVSVLDKTME